jgi:hypothetical protein
MEIVVKVADGLLQFAIGMIPRENSIELAQIDRGRRLFQLRVILKCAKNSAIWMREPFFMIGFYLLQASDGRPEHLRASHCKLGTPVEDCGGRKNEGLAAAKMRGRRERKREAGGDRNRTEVVTGKVTT